MCRSICCLLLVVLLLRLIPGLGEPVWAQYFELNGHRRHLTVPFRIIRNSVIIQVRLDDHGPYNFILDTGVGMMVITDPCIMDTLNLTRDHVLKLAGTGQGDDYDAYATRALKVGIPGLTSYGVGAAVFKEDHFGLSNYIGIPIHGLLGYDFFSRLIVKIDFTDSLLFISRPGHLRPQPHYEKIAIDIAHNKPYLTTRIRFCDKTVRTCRLIVDLGAGHPLSLESAARNQWPVDGAISANLGMGLTGPVNGEISRVNCLSLGRYQLMNILSSFPERQNNPFMYEPRDGNLGMDILKRFTIIFDYSDSLIYLKPGTRLHEPFEHDMSGLDYYSGGAGLNHIFISRVDSGSAADGAGIRVDDEITSVNFKTSPDLTLEDLDRMFSSVDGRGFVLGIYRDHKYYKVILSLKRRI